MQEHGKLIERLQSRMLIAADFNWSTKNLKARCEREDVRERLNAIDGTAAENSGGGEAEGAAPAAGTSSSSDVKSEI